jgi:hypothetical protein
VTSEPDLLTAGDERPPRRPRAGLHGRGRRLAVPALPLVALAGVAAVQLARAPAAPAPGPQRAVVVEDLAPPSPTPTPAPPPAPAPTAAARSTSTDLSTTVTVGHARLPGGSYARQLAVLQQRVPGAAALGISGSSAWMVERVRDARGQLVDGVRMQYDRRLTAASEAALSLAVTAVPGATLVLTEVPGTTVDVSVPVRAGARCLQREQDGGGVRLGPGDMDAVGRALSTFGLGADGGHATVSYSGPRRTPGQLSAVGRALARSCGAPLSTVTYTRHVAAD